MHFPLALSYTEKLKRKHTTVVGFFLNLKNILNQTRKDKIPRQSFLTMCCILFPILINIFRSTQTAEYYSV